MNGGGTVRRKDPKAVPGHRTPNSKTGFLGETKPLERADLDEFVACVHPANRYERKAAWSPKRNPEGRWRVTN